MSRLCNFTTPKTKFLSNSSRKFKNIVALISCIVLLLASCSSDSESNTDAYSATPNDSNPQTENTTTGETPHSPYLTVLQSGPFLPSNTCTRHFCFPAAFAKNAKSVAYSLITSSGW